MFENFETHDLPVEEGVTIRTLVGGNPDGPPMLLLHGHPQTHAMWHRVADRLAARHRLVIADLRGYGDSSRPVDSDDHAVYSKRRMAADMASVMTQLGFDRFLLCAHDRGARVAHRLSLDHADRVQRLMLLDIAPTLDMYVGTTEAFARAYWHWFFLIQPAPLPERLIDADPVRYIRDLMGRRHAGLAAFAPEAFAEYERCVALPGTAAALCADYRASASIDLVHDRADREAGRKLTMPTQVLWGGDGVVGKCFDVLGLWKPQADQVDGRALPSGHYIAEEAPDELFAEMTAFFGD